MCSENTTEGYRVQGVRYTPPVPRVSVTVITLNEEAHLADALQSVAWADELIVVDANSIDRTVEIARRFTTHVVCREWQGYVDQKNYAASLATGDWVLSLDADERVTEPLAQEITSTLAAADGSSPAAFRMPRVTWYLGRWIRSTDWYPDHQLRLFRRTKGRWTGGSVHEGLEVDGVVGDLRGEIQHLAYRDISEHLETIDRYSSKAAEDMYARGTRATSLQIAGHAPLAFLRNYLVRGGILDGPAGFIISSLNAYYVLLKFAKLWAIQRERLEPGPRP